MLKFFRRIRQNLLSENKFSKYLLYAIGEIILVVIGILIALWINNWNEERKGRKLERQVVQTIYDELEQNLAYSNSIFEQLQMRLSTTISLMQYTAEDELQITAQTFDSLMVQSFLLPAYTPVKANLERVLGSDQINLIRSSELQKKLTDYNTSTDQAFLYYAYAEDDFKLIVLPFFVKHYPLKIFLLKYGLNVPPTKHKGDYLSLLKSKEFENILSVIYADSGGQIEAVSHNINLMQDIKKLIEKEYLIMSGD